MNNDLNAVILRLNSHRNLQLRDAQGDCIHVHWGDLWITQEGDSRDHIVKAGESFAIRNPGTTLVSAFGEAGVSVIEKCQESGVAPAARVDAAELPATRAAVDTDLPLDATGRDLQVAADDLNADSFRLNQPHPGVAEIEWHVENAKNLRAAYFAEIVGRGWNALRRAVGIVREIG